MLEAVYVWARARVCVFVCVRWGCGAGVDVCVCGCLCVWMRVCVHVHVGAGADRAACGNASAVWGSVGRMLVADLPVPVHHHHRVVRWRQRRARAIDTSITAHESHGCCNAEPPSQCADSSDECLRRQNITVHHSRLQVTTMHGGLGHPPFGLASSATPTEGSLPRAREGVGATQPQHRGWGPIAIHKQRGRGDERVRRRPSRCDTCKHKQGRERAGACVCVGGHEGCG